MSLAHSSSVKSGSKSGSSNSARLSAKSLYSIRVDLETFADLPINIRLQKPTGAYYFNRQVSNNPGPSAHRAVHVHRAQ